MTSHTYRESKILHKSTLFEMRISGLTKGFAFVHRSLVAMQFQIFKQGFVDNEERQREK